MNILQFPSRKSKAQEIKIRIDIEVLEDGSVWYRIENLNTGTYGEWIKNAD